MDGVANLYALQWVGFALHVAAIALVWPSLRARPMLVGTGMAVAAWWLGQRAPAAWITSLREGFTRDHLRFVAGQGTQAGPLLQAVTDELGWSLSDFDPKHAPAGGVRALFEPPPSLKPRVDRLRLDIGASAGDFDISAMIDLKEGLWRALTKKDEHFTEIRGNDPGDILGKIQAFIDKWAAVNPA